MKVSFLAHYSFFYMSCPSTLLTWFCSIHGLMIHLHAELLMTPCSITINLSEKNFSNIRLIFASSAISNPGMYLHVHVDVYLCIHVYMYTCVEMPEVKCHQNRSYFV